jgi:hypothetical protein
LSLILDLQVWAISRYEKLQVRIGVFIKSLEHFLEPFLNDGAHLFPLIRELVNNILDSLFMHHGYSFLFFGWHNYEVLAFFLQILPLSNLLNDHFFHLVKSI